MSDPEAAVRAFVDAFNAEDLDAFAAALTEDVELHSYRGLVEGREEARRWATRKPTGALHQHLVIDRIETNDPYALASVRKQWFWRDPEDHDGRAADEHRFFYVATVRDGLIRRWQAFEDRAEAERAAGIATTQGRGASPAS